MRRAGIITTLVAAIALVAVAVPSLGIANSKVAARSSTPKVNVGDDFFSKGVVKVKVRKHKSKQVRFHWLGANTDSHNVILKSGPKSLTRKEKKKFRSGTGAVGIRFNPKFKKTGTYKFHCTIHPTSMQMSVKVSRKH